VCIIHRSTDFYIVTKI